MIAGYGQNRMGDQGGGMIVTRLFMKLPKLVKVIMVWIGIRFLRRGPLKI